MDAKSPVLLFLVGLVLVISVSAATSLLVTRNQGDVSKEVAKFIIENPEAVANSLRRAQEVEEEKQQKEASKNISSKQKELEEDANSPVLGNLKGDVTIVEFLDYNCGYCKRAFPDIQKLVSEDKNIKVVIKELPILGPSSVVAAKAAKAAWKLDPSKYMAFHAELLTHDAAQSEATILAAAKKAGYNDQALKTEMERPEISELLAKNSELARVIGVRGTPTFIIAGEMQRGAVDYNTMKTLAEKARSK